MVTCLLKAHAQPCITYICIHTHTKVYINTYVQYSVHLDYCDIHTNVYTYIHRLLRHTHIHTQTHVFRDSRLSSLTHAHINSRMLFHASKFHASKFCVSNTCTHSFTHLHVAPCDKAIFHHIFSLKYAGTNRDLSPDESRHPEEIKEPISESEQTNGRTSMLNIFHELGMHIHVYVNKQERSINAHRSDHFATQVSQHYYIYMHIYTHAHAHTHTTRQHIAYSICAPPKLIIRTSRAGHSL